MNRLPLDFSTVDRTEERHHGMHGSISFTRTLIPWGFIGRLELAIDTPSEGLGTFVDRIVRELLPPETLQGTSITDRKGRDPSQLLVPELSPGHLPRGEEILFVAGRTTAPDEVLPEVTTDRLTEPFTLMITSSFNRFIGDHHIEHRTQLSRSGAGAEAIDPREIGRAWPLVIDRFRFGLQLFRSHYTPLFGYAPTVERTVLIDADSSRIHLFLELERLRDRSVESFQRDDLYRNLTSIIKVTTGHSCESILEARTV